MDKKPKSLFWISAAIVGLAAALAFQAPVEAESSSTNYRINESFVGPGGQLDSESSTYKLESGQSSLGNIGVGEGSSTNYAAQLGYTTTSDPRLTCIVNTSSLNFGALSTSVPATGTATFSVLNYTAYGYSVAIVGNPPSNSGHDLAAMSSTGPSVPGTEQFGINLVANTSPATYGANPVQVPSGSFSFGIATDDYDNANNFRYVAGEAIASAPKTSGQTDYTISYLANVSTTTPGGSYSGNQTIVCTGTY